MVNKRSFSTVQEQPRVSSCDHISRMSLLTRHEAADCGQYRQAAGAGALNERPPCRRGPLLLLISFGSYREFAQQCFSDRDRGRAAQLGRFAVDPYRTITTLPSTP